MRDIEAVAGDGVEIQAFQFIARRKADRVYDDVQSIPLPAQFAEHVADLFITGDIAGQYDGRVGLRGHFVHAAFQFFGLIGVSQFRALAMHGPGDAPGDGAFAGGANDERFFSVKKTHISSSCC